MKLSFKWAALALAICVPLSANAHRTWMLPSATVLSGNDPWVTVDAAVSNDLFYFEHFPLRLDGLQVTAPDGSVAKPEMPRAANTAAPSTSICHNRESTSWRS